MFFAFRNQRFSIRASSTGFTDSEPPITCTQDRANSFDSSELTPNVCKSFNGFCRRKHVSANLYLVRRSLSSQAGAKSSDREDELENGFSELEGTDRSKAVKDTNLLDENADELIAEPDFSEVDDDDAEVSKNDLGISDTETDLSERLHTEKTADSALFRAIADAPGYSVRDALNKWVEEGNEVDRGEIYVVMLSLRKARMYARALQVSFTTRFIRLVDAIG